MRPATKALLVAAAKTEPNRREENRGERQSEMRYARYDGDREMQNGNGRNNERGGNRNEMRMGGYSEMNENPEMRRNNEMRRYAEGGNYNEGRDYAEMGGYAEMGEYDEMESRRGRRQPRDDRGRYRRRNEYRGAEMGGYEEPEDHYPFAPYMPPIPEPRYEEDPLPRMNRIGFETGEEVKTDYRSTIGYPRMNEMEHHGATGQMGHGKGNPVPKLTREQAEEWMRGLENEDGTTGAHWTFEQARQVMGQKSVSADPLTFYVVLNMMYSDYGKVFRKYGMADKLDFYVDMAKAFIEDKDSIGKDKTAAYYENIVKH